MKKIIIEGGHPLVGNVAVSGSKNAALPIIFSCILTNGISEIKNLPDIGDVRIALQIISSLGANVNKEGDVTYIDTRNLSYRTPDASLVSKIRASTYLIGSCLSRFGKCVLMPFGGCDFSARPIDMHISACLSLGGSIYGNTIKAEKLRGGEINFGKPSVGATVNAILLSASADGDSVIRGCAIEPHIDSLIEFINSCGGEVGRQGKEVFVKGKELHGGKITIIGDMIEAGTYLAAGLMCDSKISVSDCPICDMTSVLDAFRLLGSRVLIDGSSVSLAHGASSNFLSLKAKPHPGFPTDLQPIFAPLMARLSGGKICDEVWPSRFGYFDALSSFGVRSTRCSNEAKVHISEIKSGRATAPDLRGGMACILCALFAKGKSEIYSADMILRGYENLEEKLCSLGAKIKIENIT